MKYSGLKQEHLVVTLVCVCRGVQEMEVLSDDRFFKTIRSVAELLDNVGKEKRRHFFIYEKFRANQTAKFRTHKKVKFPYTS